MATNVIGPGGRPVTSLEPGNRVRLIGDDNSPVMSIIGITEGGTFVCGWFAPHDSGILERATFSIVQCSSACLERVVPASTLVN